ncbi:Methyltransferase FkbM [Ostreococcus tauri]|uniref:Methyltransferase FkbM n=1 Tax=Ostreococcus tauri TaxID=70448 RepID=Q00S45_OSTTA|nr:Methyltransferase FkbM [Ostreococcus tauri]CAL58417.1 Methyltransferase FkbM [Ostreococcus tauri]|eukprot:XP_003084352.1 Methyltransferase FkbM [Ostreococcus tauri]
MIIGRSIRHGSAAFCMLLSFSFISFFSFRSHLRPSEVQLETGWKTIDVYVGIHAKSQQNEWKSHSQVHQDVVVRAMFPDGGHYFIDLAANDWSQLSNSRSLETYDDWNGLCIEPNERYWKGHLQRRCKLVGAVVGNKNELVRFKKSNGELGGIVGAHYDNKDDNSTTGTEELYTVSLHEILSRIQVPNVIHYFSLDVEGAESVVFKHLPFDKYSFYMFTIERPTEDILQILMRKGYVEVGILGSFGDTMFLSRGTPHFDSVLKRAQSKIMEVIYPELQGNTSALTPRRVHTEKGAIRCPYTELDTCGSTLMHWQAGGR